MWKDFVPQQHVDFINVSSIQSDGVSNFTLHIFERQIWVGYLRNSYEIKKACLIIARNVNVLLLQ